MDNNDSNSDSSGNQPIEEILENIRKDKASLEGKFDENYTYREIVEKDVLDLMGFTTLSDEKKKEWHDKIADMLDLRVGLKILDSLAEEDKNTYKKLIEENKNDEATKFLDEKNIDPIEILTVESIMLKVELYLDSKVVRGQAQKTFDEQIAKEKEEDAS